MDVWGLCGGVWGGVGGELVDLSRDEGVGVGGCEGVVGGGVGGGAGEEGEGEGLRRWDYVWIIELL